VICSQLIAKVIQQKLLSAVSLMKSSAVSIMSLDISAAFDAVPHDILIQRLDNEFVVTGSCCQWRKLLRWWLVLLLALELITVTHNFTEWLTGIWISYSLYKTEQPEVFVVLEVSTHLSHSNFITYISYRCAPESSLKIGAYSCENFNLCLASITLK